MGIFDKLKQAGNYLSGGSAKVHITLNDSELHETGILKVHILCLVKDHDIMVDRLYVKLQSKETVRYRDTNYGYSNPQQRQHRYNKTSTVVTHKEEVIVDTNFRLDANGEYEWDTELQIPRSVPGTYKGVNASHEWMVQAGLAKKGNDPNSEWVIFHV